jgi:hypothetical protein
MLLALAACGPQEVVMIVVTATPDPAAATATLAPSTESTATTQAGTQVTTRQDLNMRGGDSTAYGVMTVIPGGQTVEVIGINQAGTWYQIRYHDAIGWISIGFTNGDVPAGLPVATPSAPPQTGGNQGGGNQGGGNQDNEDFEDDSFITLDIEDGDQKSVSGTIKVPSDDETDRIFITVEGWENANGDYEVDIAFQCETDDNDDVVISAAGADDGTICNNNWSHEVTEDGNRIMIVVTIPGGGELEWTVIANVGEQ